MRTYRFDVKMRPISLSSPNIAQFYSEKMTRILSAMYGRMFDGVTVRVLVKPEHKKATNNKRETWMRLDHANARWHKAGFPVKPNPATPRRRPR